MSETIAISAQKHQTEAIFKELIPQLKQLVLNETNPTAVMATLAAALHGVFQDHWLGFYLVDKTRNELVVGPFQGPLACLRIPFGKGVCGTAWKENRTIVVEDVDTFEGHIACSSLSKSEIVVPIRNASGEVLGVLDVDSIHIGHFNQIHAAYLEEICAWLGTTYLS
jgi:L-methionine (R)-S-oxide reductase